MDNSKARIKREQITELREALSYLGINLGVKDTIAVYILVMDAFNGDITVKQVMAARAAAEKDYLRFMELDKSYTVKEPAKAELKSTPNPYIKTNLASRAINPNEA